MTVTDLTAVVEIVVQLLELAAVEKYFVEVAVFGGMQTAVYVGKSQMDHLLYFVGLLE